MNKIYENLVFEGGGAKGIAYLGMLNVLEEKQILSHIKRVAGTSAGAITAGVTSLNLPYHDIKKYVDTLDFKKIKQKTTIEKKGSLSAELKAELESKLGGDLHCILRLIEDYGWYSSQYFYQWIQGVIAEQFDATKKAPPYTFEDFTKPELHKNNREFHELLIVATDMTSKQTRVFSYETSPKMEVATAIRASMSIPLFFESLEIDDYAKDTSLAHTFCDGGLLRNYPITIFDDEDVYEGNFHETGANLLTLGGKFSTPVNDKPIKNFFDYVEALVNCIERSQEDNFLHSEMDVERSILIDTSKIAITDFDIAVGDDKYNYLLQQGEKATRAYFMDK